MGDVLRGAAARARRAVVGFRPAVLREPWLWLVQFGGVVFVLDGVADWSAPAAKVLGGLTAVGAAEMWMRGGRDGEA